MKYSALMQDERSDARREERIDSFRFFILKLLAAKGSITEKSKAKIKKETDLTVLEQWMNVAINCENIEEFTKAIEMGEPLIRSK